MHQFVVLWTGTNVGGSAIIGEVSPTEIATIEDASLPLQCP